LPHGIPSRHTFERAFDRFGHRAFQASFREWVGAVRQAPDVRHLAIDGKTPPGYRSARFGPQHPVRGWAPARRLSLRRVAADAESKEITAIPAVPDLLELGGALVTLDGTVCQEAVAQKAIDEGGDHGLTVKDHLECMRTDIQRGPAQARERLRGPGARHVRGPGARRQPGRATVLFGAPQHRGTARRRRLDQLDRHRRVLP
jgi:hypothetical protein